MTEQQYRPPTAVERALLLRLLENDFPGRDVLLRQLDGLQVRIGESDGNLLLQVNSSAPRIASEFGVVAESYYYDDPSITEGPQVHVLLHVRRGALYLLEIYRDDGSPIKREPVASDLQFY